MAAPLPSMPRFVARCLEEIGLEGRCGVPVRELFDLVDARCDRQYRQYAWSVLRAMDAQQQLSFHIMHPLPASSTRGKKAAAASASSAIPQLGLGGKDPTGAKKPEAVAVATSRKRKRKWVTTLMRIDEPREDATAASSSPSAADGTPTKRRSKTPQRHLVLPSMRRIAAQTERRRRLSGADSELTANESDAAEDEETRLKSEYKKRRRKWSDGAISNEDSSTESQQPASEQLPHRREAGENIDGDTSGAAAVPAAASVAVDGATVPIKQEVDVSADNLRWVFRSPRGYRLGEEVDVTDLSYADAVLSSTDGGVLGVVASEELRLKYLGVVDPSGIETISPQYDLLEIVGRARERGENAATLANSGLFGDARKLHYLLDMLVALNYVKKNIITADRRRFNIVHLTRLAGKFHPSMISPGAVIERDAFPKDRLGQTIVEMLQARGEKTCVFADIGRELGYGKRQQEQLRNYFLQQMHADPKFPLQLFMARCNTGSDCIGRKLWCVRLQSSSSRNFKSMHGRGRHSSTSGAGPVIEQGIMEQLYSAIQDRQAVGATVPELRDILGVPTFKLPYKLAQGLISNYNISVEQVVMGKSTMYRLFAPGAAPKHDGAESSTDAIESIELPVTRSAAKLGASEGDGSSGTSFQPGTMKEAARGVVRASTAERRRQYIMGRARRDKIVSIHQLRSGLIELERTPEQIGTDWGVIDIRSVRRIIEDLEAEGAVITMDITLPPKQVLQKRFRVVKCVALPDHQQDRDAIRAFVDTYIKEQQQKYLVKENHRHGSDEYVVISSRRRGGRDQAQLTEDTPAIDSQEVVKYSAASYKLARVQLVKLHKQSRKLGMFFGMLYRCRAFHLMLWSLTNASESGSPPVSGEESKHSAVNGVDTRRLEDGEVTNGRKTAAVASRAFVLKEFLDLVGVGEYIQLVGVCELLSEAEEGLVKAAVADGKSWSSLPDAVVQKIRGLESDRFSKILRILIELGLLEVVHRTSQDLLGMLQSSDDFDSTVSKVAFATLSGGMFKIKSQVHIALSQGSKVIKQLPSEDSYVYAATFSGKSRSDLLSGRVPVVFRFGGVEDAKLYWKSLKFLSVEGAQLGRRSSSAEGVNVDLEPELVRSAPLKHHNIYTFKSWVPEATTTNSSARAKAAAAATGPLRSLKRKRFQNPSSSSAPSESALQKRRKLLKNGLSLISPVVVSAERSDVTAGKFRRHNDVKMSLRASKWTLDEDLRLMDLYIDNMSYQWFIDVPLALQKRDERVAFRTTFLARTLISWKKIAKSLSKKPNDCLLRVKELMETPVFKARVQRTKVTITQMENPGGVFHEEVQIASNPRLTALLCRALQVILHERSSYYAILADMLISRWTESEVKLVWRYLWLTELITRNSRGSTEGNDPKDRGFQLHSRVLDMGGLKMARYPMEMFCRAAEHLSFLEENAREEAMLGEDNMTCFEHEVELNAAPSHVAVELAATVTGRATMVPEFVPTDTQDEEGQDSKRAEPVKGLAGHLSRKWGGISPDDFLRDYWTVKSRFGLVDESHLGSASFSMKAIQAFSTCAETSRASGPTSRRSKQQNTSNELMGRISDELSATKSVGLTLRELTAHLTVSAPAEGPCDGVDIKLEVQRALDSMIRDGLVIEVNGYDAARFVLKEHADIWVLHPYQISKDASSDKVQFLFDKHSDVVARPWMHLDGTTNERAALRLKRKIVNIVMCYPGIEDYALHHKMRKMLSLQDMRSLVEELIADEVVYCRLHRSAAPRRANSLFDVGAVPPRQRLEESAVEIQAVAPGELRYLDYAKERLHYFPSANCVELLGAAACDADVNGQMA